MPTTGRIHSVNVGEPEEHVWQGNIVTTAIFKVPVTRRVILRKLNLDGDAQADLENHGGEFQAAYFYPYEHYAYWSETLKRDDLTNGQFGENFTLEGFLETNVHIGDIFKVGDATIQITQPRVPCFKLGLRMDDKTIVKKFMQSLRWGFYARILEEGEVGAGDAVERILTARERITIHDLIHTWYVDTSNREMAGRLADLEALAPNWRRKFEQQANM